MRPILCAALLLASALTAPAQEPSLATARQRWLRGNYEEARSQYEALAKDAKTRPTATVGLSRVLQSQGDYDGALQAVDAALKDHADHADLHARRAELLRYRGRWDDAGAAADRALALQKDHFLGRWVKACLLRDRGELKPADVEFRWFVRTYTELSNADKDIKDPDQLIIVALAGAENARMNGLADQFEFILKEVLGDALKYDKDLWIAEYHAGMLLLEKYNRGEAVDAFDKALTINPNAAEALVARGAAALQRFEVREAEQFAERALKVNPKLPDALRLRADVHLTAGDAVAALKELEQARTVAPRDEATLGRIAACFLIQRKPAEADALAAEVAKFDAKPGEFHAELAHQLEDRRLFDAAEKHYKKAAELRPTLPAAQNGLGLLYMRLGREKDAATLLDKAFEIDPFNVRVANTRKVLRHLEKYETLKTAHFELRFDPKNDKALAHYMADYLERIYADLADRFGYQPPGPVLIEVFNSHEMFSGRTIALPDLHTIGACTGRMIAMASTHARGVRKPFNWARVIKHEIVHIFNLEQTGFQCPHWLTEGLAVINEGGSRPQPWNQLLRERVPAGQLMNLDDIHLGFIRPRSPLDWHMAYCQSQLYVEYLQKAHGKAAIGEMLNAYRDGLDTTAAIQKVCKVDKATFEKGYRAHLDALVKELGARPAEKPLSFDELKAAHEKNPGDADLAARLAEAHLRKREAVEARKLAEGVLAKRARHPLALYVKARLLQQAGDVDGAKAALEDAVDRGAPEPKVLRELGKVYYSANEFAKAAELYELGRKQEPYDSQWLTELARCYAQSGSRDKQIEVLRELVPTDADDLDVRKRLARLLAEAGRHAEAEQFARQALEIDIRDKDAREVVVKALREQKRDDEATKLEKLLKGE